MADAKISGLPAAPVPSRGNWLVPVAKGVASGDTVSVPLDDLLPLSAAHRFRPPWSRKIGSDWKSNSAASAAMTASSLRAQPFTWVDGLTITAVEYYVQGSVTSGQILHVGIYEEDPDTGLPGALIWSDSVTLTTAGNKQFAVSPNITARRGVWVASYLTAGSTQFVGGGQSGNAHVQMGLPSSTAINTAINSLLSNGAWGGSMPSTFPFATDGSALTTGGAVPQFALVLAAP